MKRLAAALAVSVALMSTARADERGLELSRGFGTAGFVASGVGPVITIVSTLAAVSTVTNSPEGTTNNRGLLASGAGIILGVGITAVGPPIVVASGIGGYLAVKDMGGAPSFAPAAVGIAGFGLQAAGWAVTISQTNAYLNGNGGLYGVGTAMRWIGWTTELIGGGLQLSVNGKAARGPKGRMPRNPVAFVPTLNGGMVVGRF